MGAARRAKVPSQTTSAARLAVASHGPRFAENVALYVENAFQQPPQRPKPCRTRTGLDPRRLLFCWMPFQAHGAPLRPHARLDRMQYDELITHIHLSAPQGQARAAWTEKTSTQWPAYLLERHDGLGHHHSESRVLWLCLGLGWGLLGRCCCWLGHLAGCSRQTGGQEACGGERGCNLMRKAVGDSNCAQSGPVKYTAQHAVDLH